MCQPWSTGQNPWQRARKVEYLVRHCSNKRVHGVPRMIGHSHPQALKMTANIVYRGSRQPSKIVGLDKRAVKSRQHTAGLSRVMQIRNDVVAGARNMRQHTPKYATAVYVVLTATGSDQSRGANIVLSQVLGDEFDSIVHVARKYRIYALHDETFPQHRGDDPGLVD